MSSPEQFARKLNRVAKAVKQQDSKAIAARAQVQKRYIVESALTQNRKARPSWVSYKVVGDTARLQLRGGMAHMTELGSHLHPEGWDETPRSITHRRKKAAFKKGITLTEVSALRTPYGPKASVHHPALKPRHFWRKGLDAGRKPGHKAYERVVRQTITAALR